MTTSSEISPKASVHRRSLVVGTAALVFGHTVDFWLPSARAAAPQNRHTSRTADRWMNTWMERWRRLPQIPGGTLHVSRFKDPMYFLLKPISWKPNPDQAAAHQLVEAPTGFVTDFASIPRVFWSLLRPDGDYTYPAIIHDYMYWDQTRPKAEADTILLFGMQDFKIDRATRTTIYKAVKNFGGAAWDENARLKAQGEKRILKQYPDDPTVTWEEWKKKPGVFV